MDVVGCVAAHTLQRILDDDGRTGDAEIDCAACGRRTIPGKVGLAQCRLDLSIAGRGVLVVDQTCVVIDPLEQAACWSAIICAAGTIRLLIVDKIANNLAQEF